MIKMKKHNILFIGILMSLGVSLPAMAQDEDSYDDMQETVVKKKTPVKKAVNYTMMEVKGEVVDAVTKQPLAGIQVQALNDKRFAAMSNEKGEFTIKVPTFVTALYVHSAQFLSQHVAIGKNEGLKIVMVSDKFRKMYGEKNEAMSVPETSVHTGTSLNVETEVENNLGADVRSVNRSAGLGYGSAMFIRGLNSLNANAQPLIVVDGIIRDMQQTRQSLHDGDYNNLLLQINPDDIASVKVLKNGTALYGAKGGNGVLLITTKRGRSMAPRIEANLGIGIVKTPKMPEMMNSEQYRLYASEMLGTYPNIESLSEMKFHFLDPENKPIYYNRYFRQNTDWKKQVFDDAMVQNYSINVQGGDEVGMYNLSIGYTEGESTIKKNGLTRLNVRFNTDISIIEKLKTRFDMAYSRIDRDVFDDGAPEDLTAGPIASPSFLSLVKSPFLNPNTYYDLTGVLSGTLADADDYLAMSPFKFSLGNPAALLSAGDAVNKNRVESTEFYAVIAPKYQFNDYLSLSETFNYTLNRVSQRYYRPLTGMPTFLIEGIGPVQNQAISMFSKETSIESDTRLQFTKQLGAHFLDVFGGVRYSSFSYDNSQPSGMQDKGGNDKQPNLSTSWRYKFVDGVNDKWKTYTWYANADYNYRSRYYLTATLAAEASSRFGKNCDGIKLAGVKWGIFPGVQAAWVVTNESWFPQNRGINYLKLRAGYDISGNDDISNYAARTSFSSMKYLNDIVAAQLNNIGNDKIQWEQTNKFNVGLTANFVDNRIGVDFDYYIHRTNDLLTLKTFDNPVAGINNYWSNGGSLENTGFELTFTGKPIVSKNFNLELGASMGHYKNEVKSLPNITRQWVDGQQSAIGELASIYGKENIATFVGSPVGMFYGYRTNGVFANDAQASTAYTDPVTGQQSYLKMIDETGHDQNFVAGDMHFVDLNNDGIIDTKDRTIIGDPNPDIYGNIFANVMWKNFTLYVGLNYSLGNDVYNYQRYLLESGSDFYNQTTAMNNRWRFENQYTTMPRLAYGDPMGNSRFSDRWIEDGSYLRLKTLRLTYKVPVHWTWLQGLAIWGEANNLLTLTHYVGSDPEFSASNSVRYQGIDAGYLPLSRSFTLGVKINL